MTNKNENRESMIQVAFCLTDPSGTFSRWVGSAIASILSKTDSPIWFHILLDNTVSEENREKIRQTAENGKNIISFYQMDPLQFCTNNRYVQFYSVGSLYRLSLPEILSNQSKVIYLDADLIFNRDIKELWNIDIENDSIAAVHEICFEKGILPSIIIRDGSVREEDYFNSGLMIMNLTQIREKGNLFKMAMQFINNHPNAEFPDQDALNYLFRDDTKLLDPVWNCPTIHERKNTSKLRTVVYHFQGQKHPYFEAMTEFDKLLIQVQVSTPWGYDDVEKDLQHGIGMMSFKIGMLQNLISRISQPGLKRIYFGQNTKGMRSIMKIIPPRNIDYCLEKDSSDDSGMRHGVPVRSFEELSFEKKGTFVVLVLPEADNNQAIQQLENLGLKYGEDYFVVPTLLKIDQGGYIM